jgi:Kdo2-lipid IVA lauroyltransferase/acyltransferase
MSRPRSQVVDYAVYLLVRMFVCMVQAIPFALAKGIADGLAWLAYQVNRRHREVARDNLRQAFPGQYQPAQLDGLVRSVYRHFCGVLVEIVQLPRRLNPNNCLRYLEIPRTRQLVEILLSGRPVLLVTGHFGNWEMTSYVMGLLGFRAYAVARPLDNRYLDDFLRRFREKTGQKLLAKHGDFDKMQSILDQGGLLGALADQDAGRRGPFVDFFGRPASTHKALALLALEHNVPILVFGACKVGEPIRYRLLIDHLILPEDYRNHPNPVLAITQRFTTALEQIIRTAPAQYFWLHRRWKHQPAKPARQVA